MRCGRCCADGPRPADRAARSKALRRAGDYGIGRGSGAIRRCGIIASFTRRELLAFFLASDKELSDFLKSVERRAFKRVSYAVRDDDAALDIVQDAMIRLAEHYAERPAQELPLIFQRIVSNATMDWFRRQKLRNGLFRNFSDFENAETSDDFDILEALALPAGEGLAPDGAETLSRAQLLRIIEEAIAGLPGRQREAFLLRYWEELNVADTAQVMGCSEGSVKTHCSRAVQALAQALRLRGIRP